MKTLLAYIILFASLLSCSPEKQEERKTLGNQLEDFRACLENPEESFDNVRDLSLGFSLSYPEYWDYKDKGNGPGNRLSISHTILDTVDYSIKDGLYMAAHFLKEDIVKFDSLMQKMITQKEEENIKGEFINLGKGDAFGKPCYWTIDRLNLEGLEFKALRLYFPSEDKKHILMYAYKSFDTDQWYNNICTMLRFKQDV